MVTCKEKEQNMRFRARIHHPTATEVNKIKPTNLLLAKDPLELAQFCRLIQSIRNNDRRTVESLMRKGIPCIADYVHPTEGETALGLAASKNDDAMVRFLIELGASPNIVDLQGRSAAMKAAELGFVEAMEAVATASCNMKLIDEDGKGVLFYCLCPTRRHLRCAEIAIDHGADVNNVCAQGLPVFVSACETAKDTEQLCLAMLNAGADPRIVDTDSGRTAVMAAASSGSPKVLKAVLEAGGEVNEIMSKGKFHALHEAAKSGCLECMQIMSAYGADFNQQTDRGFSESLTPIHITAAARDNPIICTFLGQRGTNAKLKNREGETARQVAKTHFYKQTAKACRKTEKMYGPRAKRLPSWKLALHDFCYIREEALLEEFMKLDPESKCTVPKQDFEEVLKSFGAPVYVSQHEEDEEWTNFLELHTRNKEIDYVTFLMGKKYVPKKFLMTAFEPKRKKEKKRKGEKKEKTTTPICLLPPLSRPKTFVPQLIPFTDHMRFNRDHIPAHPLEDDSAWYMDRPGSPGIQMNDAVRHEDKDTVNRANEANNMQVIIPDRFYKSSLAVAAAMGNLDMVRLLVESGANVNQRDNFLWSPLHLACHSGKRNVVEYLLDRGAKINVPSLNQATPIMKAIESCSPDVVQLLIDRGAEVRVEDRAALSPLELSACFANYAIFSALKRKEDSLPPVKENQRRPPTKKEKPKPIIPTLLPEVLAMQNSGAEMEREDEDDSVPLRHRPSLLEPATSLVRGYPFDDDVTYIPRQVWTTVQSTEELIVARQRRRQQYGWMVDFDDFLMPFQKNVADKVGDIEAEEAIYSKRPVQMIKRPVTAKPSAGKAKGGPLVRGRRHK